MIQRYNILQLLGNDTRKYHSCIITSYSFDFLFFEQRVLPVLRNAGIININVFVDANMFQQKLQDTVGLSLANKKSYSIIPIHLKGAFHPKIVMAIGKKTGLLAIGSGNLTSSGLSSNDEIWAAFHTKELNKANQPIFKHIKNYINNLKQHVYGFNIEKLNWIDANAKWYNELSTIKLPTENVTTSQQEQLQLLSSTANNSIYKQLIAILPKKPKQIKILSPYYNKNGALITQFIQDLQPTQIHAVIDTKYGTVPYQFNPLKNTTFSDWQDLQKEAKFQKSTFTCKSFSI